MNRFNDSTLHCLIHLSGQTSYPIIKLRNAIRNFTIECLEPAIKRGWVELRTGGKGSSIVEITESGEKWLRKLCDLSEAEAKL
jgi:hypothetical protein